MTADQSTLAAAPARVPAVAGVLALAMGISMFPVPAVSVLLPFILDDLAMSRGQAGLLITALSLVTGLSAPVTGRIADRFGGRRVLLGIFAATGCLALAFGLAPGFWALLAVSSLAGVATGASNPSTNRVILSVVPLRRHGLVMGVKQSGVQAGIAGMSFVLPAAALTWGWRASVAALAVVAFVGLGLAYWVLPTAGRRSAPASGRGTPRRRTAPWLVGFAFLMGAGSAAVVAFLPLYAHEALGLSPARAGQAAGAVGVLGVVSRIAAGHFVPHGRSLAPLLGVVAAASTLSGWLLVLADNISAMLLWPAVLLTGTFVVSWNVLAMMAVMGDGPETGRSTGVLVLAFMAGMTPSPVLFGATVDRMGGYTFGWSIVTALYAAAAVACLGWWLQERRAVEAA